MKPSIFINRAAERKNMVSRSRHFQRGDFLVEAIIGLALMAVVGIGVIHMNGRISASKHETSIQDLAITQMRDLLQKNGSGTTDLCTTAPTIPLPGYANGLPVTVDGCINVPSVTIGGVAVSGYKEPLVLSVTLGKDSADEDIKITVGGAL